MTSIVDTAPTAGRHARPTDPPRALRLLVYEENTDSIGGNQRYICLLLQYGAKAGMDVVLVTPREGVLADTARRYGAVSVLSRRQAREPYAVRCARLRARIRTVKPDAILCNNTKSLGTGLVAARLARTPVLWYVKTETRSRLRNLAFGLAADRVLAISPSVFEDGRGRVGAALVRRSVHLPIGIELDRFVTIPPAPATPGLHALVLARIHPDKRLDVVLDALDALGPEASGIRVVIAGGVAPGLEAYARHVATRAAAARHATVELRGWSDDVPGLLTDADAVVLASRTEGVSRSLVEAMAASRPVLATRVGGLGDLIAHGETGLLVNVDDREAIARMLVWLRDHPDERRQLGARARQDVVPRFDIGGHVRALAREVETLGSRT
ncbi:MAG: glycosyltransferase family 4 protein [Candidatus Rokubacteria bacterium]|nr:glycosyltransferase family 4 protein [Candidatus Rokubacteria bacterium]